MRLVLVLWHEVSVNNTGPNMSRQLEHLEIFVACSTVNVTAQRQSPVEYLFHPAHIP
jgi:hypothetical protein